MSCNQQQTPQVSPANQPANVSQTASSSQGTTHQYREIAVDELKTAFGEEDYVIIDVRTPEEIAMGMIDGAQHIDYVSNDFKETLDKLDRSTNYVVYCRSGGRSTKACQIMQKQGFENVVNLEGGYLAYTDSQ